MAERPKGGDMRNSRFKAWDTKEKKWFEPVYMAYMGDLSELVINQNGSVCLRTMNGFYGTHPDDDSGQPLNERFIICWYTGLKDKNGVEIYYGDLLDHPYFDDPIAVEWNNDEACFESNGVVREWVDCEVIGNIYQNTDLLEK